MVTRRRFLEMATALFLVGCNIESIPVVTPVSSPTPPVAIRTPSPTPARESIVVECKTCTPEELSKFTQLSKLAYQRVAEGFGMEPQYGVFGFEGFKVEIAGNKQTFGLNGSHDSFYPVGLLIGRTGDDSSGLGHELVHKFEDYLLGRTGQFWWGEGLAEYIPSRLGKEYWVIFEELKKDKSIWDKNPHLKDAHSTGDLYFVGLIERGLTREQNKIAIRNLAEMRPKPYSLIQNWASPRQINLAYERALGLRGNELDYLLELLEPGIKFNGYVR